MEDWQYTPAKNYETGSSEPEDHESFLPEHESHPESVEAQKVPEDALAAEAIKKNPKAIFEHVVAAAQRKEALERLYELRQEVKDEPANGSVGQQTAVPVGAVLADDPSRQGVPAIPQPPRASVPQPALPLEPEENPKTSIYRHAVITGFITALILLISFGILLLLRR